MEIDLVNDSRVFCITFDIGKNFGGMTSSLLKRAKIFGEHKNIPTTVVTFSMNYELGKNLELLNGNKLGEITTVVNLYDFLSGEEFRISDTINHNIEEDGCTYYKEDTKRIYKIFKNGRYIMRKDFEAYGGRLSSISYINDELVIYKKEEYDTSGYLRRTIFYDTKIKKMKQVLYHRMDKSCYMVKYFKYRNNSNETFKIYIFDKNEKIIKQFKNEGETRKWFLDALTNEYKHNFFIVDSKALLSDIVNYESSNNEVYKIYVNHCIHTVYPYNFDSEIAEDKKIIFDNIQKHDAIIVLTKEQNRDIELRYGKLNNCFIIPHSYSVENSGSNFNDRDLKKVVSISRLDEEKQLDHIIKAFKIVIDKLPNATLEFYGDGEFKSSMEQLINELNIENNVFIRGFTHDVKSIFQKASMMVMASKEEGQGLVILESLGSGCPVISYKTKYGPSDMIIDGVNGYLVEYNKIDKLAEKIIQLLSDSEKVRFLSENCKSSISEFSDEIFINRWLELFDILIKRRRLKKIVNKNNIYIKESNWIENRKYKIIYNIENIDEFLYENISINYRFRKRDTNEYIDFYFSEYELRRKIINIDIINENGDIIFSNGYWDIYLVFTLNNEIYEKRLGTLNKDEVIDKKEKIIDKTKKSIKPYYTKYNNFSFKVIFKK